MDKESVLKVLRDFKETPSLQFGVHRLALFGSTARDSAKVDRDIDL